MRKFAMVMMTLSVIMLGACTSNGGFGGFNGMGTKQTVGAGSGAILGGIAGAQVGGGDGRLIATGVGAVLGGLLGSEIGKSLDRADMAYMSRANARAHEVPIGQTVQWNNPESGHSGSITPRRDGTSSLGRYCREYEQTITVDGRRETAVGTACQNSDGTWEVLNS